MDEILRRASDIHAVGYFGVLILVALVEGVVPRRRPGDTWAARWFGNIALAVICTLVVRTVFPVAALALAILCAERGWGLFNVVALPTGAAVVVTVLLLDLVVYVQHWLLHRVDLLWRLHRAHHTDVEFDLTTGLRFHPLESIFATTVTLLTVLALGVPPLGVLIWQVLSAGINFLEHANIRFPAPVERVARLVLVTPEMHRIHHSAAPGESLANFSNIFSWWDRVFGTYVDQPAAGHDAMTFGLEGFEDPKYQQIHWVLAQPFISEPTDAPASSSAPVRVPPHPPSAASR